MAGPPSIHAGEGGRVRGRLPACEGLLCPPTKFMLRLYCRSSNGRGGNCKFVHSLGRSAGESLICSISKVTSTPNSRAASTLPPGFGFFKRRMARANASSVIGGNVSAVRVYRRNGAHVLTHPQNASDPLGWPNGGTAIPRADRSGSSRCVGMQRCAYRRGLGAKQGVSWLVAIGAGDLAGISRRR